MKEPKKVSPDKGMNPHKARREIGQKNPKPNLGMNKPMRLSPRGR